VATDIEKFAELVGADFLQSYYERRAQLKISARLVWPYCAFVKKVQPRLASYLMKVRISR